MILAIRWCSSRVELLFCKQVVAGASPVTSSKILGGAMGKATVEAIQKLREILDVCQKQNEELRQTVIKVIDNTDRIRTLERKLLLTPNMN